MHESIARNVQAWPWSWACLRDNYELDGPGASPLSRLDRVRNNEIRQRCANADLLQTVLRRSRLRWLGHVGCVLPERVPLQLLFGDRQGRQRPQGRMKTRVRLSYKSPVCQFNASLHVPFWAA